MSPPKEKVQPKHLICDIFRPIHIVLRIFGITFFTAQQSRRFQILDMFYTLICFMAFVGSFSYRISSEVARFCQSDPVAQSVMGIQQMLSTLAIIAIYFQVIFYREQFHELIKTITSTNDAFSTMNVTFSEKKFATKILCEVILLTAFIYITFIVFVIYYDVRQIEFILLELFTSINPMLIIIVNVTKFVNFTWFIYDKFEMLKHILTDVCAIDLSNETDSNGVCKVKLIRETAHGLYDDFRKITHIYELLFTMAQNLNDIFGFSNLASMCEEFCISFFFIFYFNRFSYYFVFHYNWQIIIIISEFLALFSISLTCHLFLLFKLLTENTNNMNDIQVDVLGTFVTV